jgi:Tol biopolymer transport system component
LFRFVKNSLVACALTVASTSSVAVDLVSINKDGTDSRSGESFRIMISDNGRYAAFTSRANNLVANDSNGETDVLVQDLQNGITSLASINKQGDDTRSGSSSLGEISADGRLIVIISSSDDLTETDTNNQADVFLRDQHTGVTSLISVNNTGTDSGSRSSFSPMITPDGRYVVFLSLANDLVPTDTNNKLDVFIRDLGSGTTSLVSMNSDDLFRHDLHIGITSLVSVNKVIMITFMQGIQDYRIIEIPGKLAELLR